MASYVEKQLFKTRFWKHIWNLDTEGLRELLDEGNPIGHVNFPFRVPSDHGYVFHTAYKGRVYKISNTKDKSTSEFRNEAIENYLNSYGAKACDILWKMYRKMEGGDGELYLPNGVEILGLDEILDIISILAEHGADLYFAYKAVKWPGAKSVNISDISMVLMTMCNLTYEKIHGIVLGSSSSWNWTRREYYQLMLLCYPLNFNRFVDDFPFRKGMFETWDNVYDFLFSWCKASDVVTKRVWKLRLVKLDPERWSLKGHDYDDEISVEGLDGVSVEELKAMYEGHPKNINVHDVELALSDRPAKKAKSDTRWSDGMTVKEEETAMIVDGILHPPEI